jgi:quercetin dioxygenase-like cupin family protein
VSRRARLGALLLVAAVLGACAAPGPAREPQARIQEQVTLDSDQVRVSLLTFDPGAASGRHVGLEPELGIVAEGELTLITDAGREVLRAGAARYLPALVPHDARNEGDRPLKLWVVIHKKCD